MMTDNLDLLCFDLRPNGLSSCFYHLILAHSYPFMQTCAWTGIAFLRRFLKVHQTRLAFQPVLPAPQTRGPSSLHPWRIIIARASL